MEHEQFVPWSDWQARGCIGKDQLGEIWAISRDGQHAWMRVLPPGPTARRWAQKWTEMVCLPYVVCFDAVEESAGTLYIRMEMLTALPDVPPSVRERPEEVALLGKQIGTAVAACRQKGISCGPVVPGNMYAADDGSYRLDVYGAAALFLEEPRGNMRYFRAPEEERGRDGGPQTEVYTLGLTMYWLLNGCRMPFHPPLPAPVTRDSELESYELRMGGTRLPPPKNGSEALHRIILRACAYRRRERWKDAGQLAEQIQALESGRKPGMKTGKGLWWAIPAAAAALGLLAFWPGRPEIPEDAVEFGGHHYYIYDADVADFREAAEFCRSLGGELAAVTSEEENQFLYEYLKKNGYDHVFLGASDEEEDGTWVWTSGEPFTFCKWAPGEPNNDLGGEDHIAMYRVLQDGSWNDITFVTPGFRDEAAMVGSVSATSQLVADGSSYGPGNLTDGKAETAWFEGVPGLGSGESVTLHFRVPSRLTGMSMMPGDQRSPEHYARASRPALVELAFDDGTVYRFALEDACREQTFSFGSMVTARSVTVTVCSIYPGSQTEDTGISELWFRSENGKTGFFCEWDR